MTKQEFYDALVTAASDGTFPSAKPGEYTRTCLYALRDDKNPEIIHRCAAGLLLQDLSLAKTEGMRGGCYHHAELFNSRLPEGMTLDDLSQTQVIHDDCCVSKMSEDEQDKSMHVIFLKERFLKSLNSLPFFADCQQTKPQEVAH